MIKSGYKCWMFDVSFNHPDDSSFSTSVCYIADKDDMADREDFMDIVCKEIWEKYNDSHYYHDMYISCDYILDRAIYTTHYSYNGYDLDRHPSTIRNIVEV